MSAQLASAIQDLLDVFDSLPFLPAEAQRSRLEEAYQNVAGLTLAAGLGEPPCSTNAASAGTQPVPQVRLRRSVQPHGEGLKCCSWEVGRPAKHGEENWRCC
jgi:hypothetical protein